MEMAGLKREDDYGLDRPDIASLILEQFFFVGITEEMPKAIATLEDHMVVMRAMKAAYGFEKWAKEAKNIELLQKSIEVKWVAQRLVGQSLTEMAKKGLPRFG